MKNNKRFKDHRKLSVAVVGATGLVGREMLRVLEERHFPYDVTKLYAFASSASAGESISVGDAEILVEELNENSFKKHQIDFVLFATSAEVSAKYVPLATAAGAIAIDNSSHFRMNREIPLIVPEVNPDEIEKARQTKIIANPNCSTIQLVVCLKPLQERYGLKRVIVSSYQSVSGAGSEALDELQNQVSSLFSHGEIQKKIFPHQIAFNCIPQIDKFLANGFTKEEMKIIEETRKIMGLPNLKITATAVRVPTFISHSESVNVELDDIVDLDEVRDALTEAGVIVLDEPEKSLYPLGFEVTGSDEVFAGRIRKDESVENGLHLWIVADNLRKGAATNAVQIAETCLDRQWI